MEKIVNGLFPQPHHAGGDEDDHVRSSHVPVFNLDKIPVGSNILVCGRRGVGKSYLVTQLLKHRQRGAVPIVFASKYVVDFYRQYLPYECVSHGFSERKLDRIIQSQIANKGRQEIVIAFDDVTNENTCLMKNTTVRDVVKYGSSLNITTVFSSQHCGVYDETFRRNVDYVFLFHDNLIDNQEMAYKRYAHMFSTLDDFKSCYRKCTMKPHRCLVLDMRQPWKSFADENSGRHGPPDGVYSYKARLDDITEGASTTPCYEENLGTKRFWEFWK